MDETEQFVEVRGERRIMRQEGRKNSVILLTPAGWR